MFFPNGWSVIAIYDDFSKCIASYDYKDQAISCAKDADASWAGVNIMDRPVYSIRQNYPTKVYID